MLCCSHDRWDAPHALASIDLDTRRDERKERMVNYHGDEEKVDEEDGQEENHEAQSDQEEGFLKKEEGLMVSPVLCE